MRNLWHVQILWSKCVAMIEIFRWYGEVEIMLRKVRQGIDDEDL